MLMHGNFIYSGILQAIDAATDRIVNDVNKFNFHREHTMQKAIDPKINDGKKKQKEKNRIEIDPTKQQKR